MPHPASLRIEREQHLCHHQRDQLGIRQLRSLATASTRRGDMIVDEHIQFGGVCNPDHVPGMTSRLRRRIEFDFPEPEYAEWLHDRVPHAELSWVEGAGHLLQEDAPARLLAHLTADFPTGS